jgi:PST family polysaccharide transporter
MSSTNSRGAELGNWRAAWSSALLTGSRVASALVVNKIIAAYLGPSGLALVGQFQNFTAVVFGLSSGNVSNAVIATVAGAGDEEQRQKAVSTAIAVTALGTGAMALGVAMAARPIAAGALGDGALAPVLHGLALMMVPLILNVVLLAVAAGLGQVRAFVAINVGIAVVSVPVCWLMVVGYGIAGALLAAVVVNAAAVLATGAWLLRARPFPVRWIWAGIDAQSSRRLVGLAAMTLSTIIAVPMAQFLVRQQVVHEFGMVEAGHWQAALKTGEILLMGASVIVSLHFLPRFAHAGAGLKRYVLRAAGRVAVGLAAVGAVVAAAGGLVLPLLFSRDFVVATDLLPLQVAGDVLRGGVIVLQAAFLARARMASYVAVDLVYASVMIGVGMLLVPVRGTHGAVTAVVVASVCSLGAAALLLRRLKSAEAE